jgi:hypothetical protein
MCVRYRLDCLCVQEVHRWCRAMDRSGIQIVQEIVSFATNKSRVFSLFFQT